MQRETPLHLFYECEYTERLLNRFFNGLGIEGEVRRTDFFGSFEFENNAKNDILCTLSSLFRFYIWEQKLRKSHPEFREMIVFVKSEIIIFKKISTQFNFRLAQSGLEPLLDQMAIN